MVIETQCVIDVIYYIILYYSFYYILFAYSAYSTIETAVLYCSNNCNAVNFYLHSFRKSRCLDTRSRRCHGTVLEIVRVNLVDGSLRIQIIRNRKDQERYAMRYDETSVLNIIFIISFPSFRPILETRCFYLQNFGDRRERPCNEQHSQVRHQLFVGLRPCFLRLVESLLAHPHPQLCCLSWDQWQYCLNNTTCLRLGPPESMVLEDLEHRLFLFP